MIIRDTCIKKYFSLLSIWIAEEGEAPYKVSSQGPENSQYYPTETSKLYNIFIALSITQN